MASNKQIYIDYEAFKKGLYALDDTTRAPFGTARIMENMRVTELGGIGPRLGTELLGTFNSATNAGGGLYNFRKAVDQDEFLLKAYDDEMEVYSKNHSSSDWWRLKSGFTSGKEFGFVTSLVNTDNQDYVVFCNRYDPYQRWSGAVTLLNGALAGGETTITVDSTLTDEVFYSGTATSNAATTLDVSSAPWAASQWVNFYVRITSGVHTGLVRLISATTTTQITFATLGSAPGNCTFEIRMLAFPASGTLIVGGATLAYSAVPTDTTFTTSAAAATADNSVVSLVPTEYLAAPRGNRLTNFLGRIIVGNVRSALARDSGGTLSGFASAGSYFVSKLLNPFDFGFTATRVAGEGDIIATPYGGGDITDVSVQEDTAYVFKKRYIESVKYSQDSNDLAVRTPLKAEVGAVGPVIKGSDDIYFMTDDKKFTSLGRVASKDVLPQTDNIGFKIQRLLNAYTFGDGRGIEDVDRIYYPCKSASTQTANDLVLVYNKVNQSFEGTWNIPARFFARFNSKTYFIESVTPNVFELNTGHADVVGATRYAIIAQYASHFLNLTPSHGNVQALNSLYFEGYIDGTTEVTFKAWKDFSDVAFLEFTFTGNESSFLDGAELAAFLGGVPFAFHPIGGLDGDEDADGRRHFFFHVYFPYQYGNHFSVGFNSSAADDNYELTRIGLGLAESVSTDVSRVKSV